MQLIINYSSPLYLQTGGLNLQLLYKSLQLERVGLALTGFIRTNPPAPAGRCVHGRLNDDATKADDASVFSSSSTKYNELKKNVKCVQVL